MRGKSLTCRQALTSPGLRPSDSGHRPEKFYFAIGKSETYRAPEVKDLSLLEQDFRAVQRYQPSGGGKPPFPTCELADFELPSQPANYRSLISALRAPAGLP
jgi:hypothetical protein